MRSVLRGHVLLSEEVLNGESGGCYIFTEDVTVNSGQFVILRSGSGENGWRTTKDGAHVYYVFANFASPVWSHVETAKLHILHVQHTYTERRESLVPV